jgi:antagonist of KipI
MPAARCLDISRWCLLDDTAKYVKGYCLHPGQLATVQDRGRSGHQHEGIPMAGAMDELALRVGNLLVGNDENAAALECTLVGPTFRFDEHMLIAVTGGDLGVTVDGTAIPLWRPVAVPAGATVSAAAAVRGCRGYLAIGGGIDVPPVLGSRSTYARASLGGFAGRALRRGDLLPIGAPSELSKRIDARLVGDGGPNRLVVSRWGASAWLVPFYTSTPVIRLLEGAHTRELTTESRERLFKEEFRVAAQSDRMGYRLEGPGLELVSPRELLSEAVAFGTVQLPPGGTPIVLMADRQTTGGYPRIGEVASVDLPLLAQLKAGDRVRFRPISLEEAQRLYLGREDNIGQARAAIALYHH